MIATEAANIAVDWTEEIQNYSLLWLRLLNRFTIIIFSVVVKSDEFTYIDAKTSRDWVFELWLRAEVFTSRCAYTLAKLRIELFCLTTLFLFIFFIC